MPGRNGQFYEFGEFRLDAQQPSLWLDGQLVPLPPKALEMLVLLVANHGQIVSREELLESVWRDTFVEEANINYTVSLLRKTLGARDKQAFIQTVPKRGYRFVAEIRQPDRVAAASEAAAGESDPAGRPQPIRWHFVAIILLGVLFLTSFTLWWQFNDPNIAATERDIRSVAILPFKNLNEDEQNKALALGLTDTLISRLGRLNRFTVRPLDAVEKYERGGKDAIKFGQQLKTDAVLEGTFQSVESGRLRVNVRLWDVRDGAQIWEGSFDETETDIFILQDKLSSSVAKSLIASLTQPDEQILTKRYTENAEAFRAYLRGREILDQRLPGRVQRALIEFQKAIELDPAFSLAYTGLADTFLIRASVLPGEEGRISYDKAKSYAEKAIELDSESAESLTALAMLRLHHDWDWPGAEKNFVRAIRLNPNYAKAHQRYSVLLSILGRHDEALASVKKAVEINPISQSVLSSHFPVLESRGEYDEALRIAEELYNFDRESIVPRIGYGTFLYHRGDYDRVIALGEESLAKEAGMPKTDTMNYRWYSLLAASYQKKGDAARSAEMLRQLERLAQNDTKALYSLAMNYAELGRREDAVAALQKCFELREERMLWLKNEPRLAGVRDDPRVQQILREMKLIN